MRRANDASTSNLRAARIPEGAVRGFATVGSLVQSEFFPQEPAEIPAKPRRRRGSQESINMETVPTRKPRKRAIKEPAAEMDDKPKPKPRVRKPKAIKDSPAEDLELHFPAHTKSHYFSHDPAEPTIEPLIEDAPKLTKAGKPRKPRAKKAKAEDEGTEAAPKPKRTRVTKAKVAAKDRDSEGAAASVVSAHFIDNVENNTPAPDKVNPLEQPGSTKTHNAELQDAAIWELPPSPKPKKKAPPKKRAPVEAVELDLEEAVPRRRDWTPPPKDTSVKSPFIDSAGKENKISTSDAGGSFTHMLNNFAYVQPLSEQTAAKAAASTIQVSAVTKRRRVEVSIEPPDSSCPC